jgi:hypothetical protein
MATSARRPADGLFNADTRYLARLELVLDDVQPLFVAVACNKPASFKPAPFCRGLLAHRREMRHLTALVSSHGAVLGWHDRVVDLLEVPADVRVGGRWC